MDRLEGLAKLTGSVRYVDDLRVDGALWGATVRSRVARGTIRAVRFDPSFDYSGVVVVDHRDIPGPNEIRLIELDQPVLCAERVMHAHEPVLLLAHESRDYVRRAVESITIEVDPLPAVLDYRATPSADQIQFADDNVLKRLLIEKGDVERALADAPRVIEGVYETGAQEHVYLENNGMIAWVENGVVCVKGSMQCPYYVLNALKHALDRDEHELRVIQAPTGGGFGGKEEFPSNVAIHAALLAMKAERPVKLIYDRTEDMVSSTKRHPCRTRHRTGVDGDGRIVAQAIDVVMDGGAYITLSPVVLSRGIIHAGGPYACDHVRITGTTVLTNTVPYGAFRGFGAPQTLFALERHMDVIAHEIGMDPVEFRERNLIRDEQSTSTGQVIRDGTDRVSVMKRALESARYHERRTEHERFNREHPYLRRGVGFATFYHGAGFTGAGEVYLSSVVNVRGLEDGRVEVLAASTEIGQGTTTVFTQIAANRLGVGPEMIVVAEPDTSRVPNSGPTVASRTVMVVGHLIERACDELMNKAGANGDACAAIRAWHAAHPGEDLIGSARYRKPPDVVWDEETYQGDAYAAFAWATYVADVEIDLRTYEARVTDFVAVQEVGTVINETLARGQIQGGVVQGIGWALMEECRPDDEGGMANGQLTNYIIPTSADVPPIRVEFLSNPFAYGGMGAKGIGELPIDGPAPAIANAVSSALGVRADTIPLVPERLMEMAEHA